MQAAPSNKAYSQALAKLKDLTRKYGTVRTRSVDELAEEVEKTLQELDGLSEEGLTLNYKLVEFGQVPNSFEMNLFLESLSQDINVLIDEMDILKASSIHTHNFIKTEILKSEQQNRILHSKIKSLQLFGNGEDSSIQYVGDYFYNDDNIDWNMVPASLRVELIKGDQISLGVKNQVQVIKTNSLVTISDGSNGFVGNNHEVLKEGSRSTFVDQSTNLFSTNLKKIVDQQPNTVFEFEKYEVSRADRNKAKDYNFSYTLTDSDETKYLSGGTKLVSWADGLTGNLKLNLVINLGSIQTLNLISFTPFGLSENKNAPLLIKSVSVSRDRNTWVKLAPENVYVANGIDQNTISLSSNNIVIGNATFRLDAELAQYISFEIEQEKANIVDIGHFYYVKEVEQNLINTKPSELVQERFEGYIPPVDKIWLEKDPKKAHQRPLVQKKEVFSGKRWAIGIKDIAAFSTKYAQTSSLVSKRFYVPGGIDRVALEADIAYPTEFDSSMSWVKFYVSPDDGLTWHPISRIQEDYIGIPEIIAYNDSIPKELRLPGVGYHETIKTPDSIRLKIEISRPLDNDTLTPVVKSYKLKIKHRSNL